MISNIYYLKEVLSQTQRLLSLLDRNPISKTYGCFDRQYWHYNTSDFACARSQEAVLTLALLYNIKHNDNIYYRNKKVLDWINAGLIFWTKIQENNGSFNEWYPKENSFVATAFSLYAISETLLQQPKDENWKNEEISSSLKKAGDWILNKNEKRVQNQEAGAAIALYNLYLLTHEIKYRESSEDKIRFIINNQTEEGWFYEYGSADIGYLSLCIDYLAKYYQKTGNEELLTVLKKAVGFISYFIHPNYTVGGEYGSRNTEYLIPDGFEIFAKEIHEANVISNHIKESLQNKSAVFPFSIDDKYLSYILYTYLQAYLDSNSFETNVQPKYKQTFSNFFPDAGIWIHSDKSIYLITNFKKGGAFKLFSKANKIAVYDSGITLKTIDGKKLTSGWLSNQNKMNISGNNLEVEGTFSEVTDNILTPSKNVLLRMFGLTLGRSEKIGLMVKEKLRNKLIAGANPSVIKFFRKISIDDKTIITDKISDVDKIDELIVGSKASYIYVPSSRYFQISELNSLPITYQKSDLLGYKNSKEIVITRHYNKMGELIKQSVSGAK
jgi:hypothetical protein